ncbi:zinc ribbon domain-containing protein [Enterococcus lactis]
MCSECGHNDDKKPLKIKESSCPICHTHHDRDNNASIDILTERLRMQALV